jgi:hypothetical protein
LFLVKNGSFQACHEFHLLITVLFADFDYFAVRTSAKAGAAEDVNIVIGLSLLVVAVDWGLERQIVLDIANT